jgi:hypothetical protein
MSSGRLLLVLLLLPLLGAGCGGETSVPGFHRAASRAAWIGGVNRICAKRAAAVQKLPAPRTQNELIDAGQRIISLEDLEYSRLAKIHPPVDDQAAASAFLAAIRRVQRGIDRVRGALQLRNATDLAAAKTALAAARREANTKARRLGLNCRH